MSDRDAFRAEPGDDLKTPDEWCKLLGYEVMDPDGWRGSNGRPWMDPISQAEFEARIVTCTLRRVDPRAAFRAEQQTRRLFGKAKQHEKRLENATYTAAEVKVLTETATRVALELGRREAFAQAIGEVEKEARWQVELMLRDSKEEWGHSVQRLNVVANCLRTFSQPSQAASDATSGVPKSPKLSVKPTVRSNRLPGGAS
jgi:hypothetical protein